MPPPAKVEVDVAGRRLTLSNLDKVLYPEAHFTKAEVIDYYARIAPVMVPHLAGRPITFKRYPDGVDGKYFFEKNAPSHTPEWVPTMTLAGGERDGSSVINYPRIEEPAALVWAANLAAIEIHPGLARADHIRQPDHVVFDLDPGEGTDIVECCQVGLWLRDALGDLGLRAWPKTSGSKGLQVYVPLHTPCDFEDTRAFSLAIAQLLEKWHPDLIVTTQEKDKRKDKVLIDWLQNASFKTTIGVYSLRARPQPTVSTPVTWDEVVAADFADDLCFTAADVLARVEQHGDLWAEILTVEQRLPGM
ncbi:MAG TPA: non-homologous end-joining DNA ligase [Acidimicrobiales bacterium]|nr:non-homologous end-joining DNA ligase [Acidimicrobiales bacterium]